jgi:phosphatidylglycerophosphate synthase
MPSIADLREATQPRVLHERSGYEHWAGRLYMRRLSPYVTRLLVATPLSANAVTALMIPVGLLAALSLTLPGLAGAVGAVLLVQLWLLLDCCDGEVARWRRTFSPVGPYLDGFNHAVTQAAIPAALGVRADGGWGSIAGWTALGLVAALLVLVVSLESHLVHSVRARTGRPPLDGSSEANAPRPGAVRRLRGVIRVLPVHRSFNPVEGSLLALAAALVDALTDDLVGTRALVLALGAAGAVTVAGHLLIIVSSERLR